MTFAHANISEEAGGRMVIPAGQPGLALLSRGGTAASVAVVGPGGDAAAPPLETPSSTRSLSPEEKQKEKERLQLMVREFAKQVVLGQPCKWIDPVFRQPPSDAIYSIDRSLRNFQVQVQAGGPTHVVPMPRIIDVVKSPQATRQFDWLPAQAPSLGIDDFDGRFVCVLQQGSDGSPGPEFGMLMPDFDERERFFTCVKILRWAMEGR